MIGAVAGALIGGGANLITGIYAAKQAKKAAEIQRQAAIAAGQHVEDTVRGVNPGITEAAGRAGARVSDAGWNAIEGVNQATREANLKLDPYAAAGADASGYIREGITPGGDFNRVPTREEIELDPGYAFRLTEGQKALERSAAARGGATGGGALKAITGYSQDMASQEYKNAFQRLRDTTQDRFSRLFDVSGKGQEASGKQGTNLIDTSRFGADLSVDTSKYAGNLDVAAADRTAQNTIEGSRIAGGYTTGAGEARASGIVGGSNAITGAVSGGVNSITAALRLKEYLKNPALNKFNPNFYGSEDLGRMIAGEEYARRVAARP